MKKIYKDTDEIELRLKYNIADHYWLEWRYKEPRKFLWFTIKDRWKMLPYYTGTHGPDDNPNEDLFWYWRGFHLGRDPEVEEFEHVKGMVKTKKDLDRYYGVQGNYAWYENDLKVHRKWLKKLNDNIEKYTK